MSISTSQNSVENKIQARNAFLVTALIAVADFVVAAYCLYLGQTSGGAQYFTLAAVSFAFALVSVIGAMLSRRGNPALGVILVLSSMAIAFPPIQTLVSGLGLVAGVGFAFVGPLIAFYTLPRRAGWVLSVVAVVSGLATLLLDVFGSLSRPALLGGAIQIVAVLVIGALVFFVFRQLWMSGRIQNRIIVIMSAVLLPVIVAFAWYNVQAQRQDLEKELIKKAETAAMSGAATIGHLFEEAVANGDLTTEQVFDTNYTLYWKFDPTTYEFTGDPATLNKYHTAYDAYTDKKWQKLLDSFLNQTDFVYTVALDVNGYIPTHNTRWASWDGSPATDRSKRIFNDPVGITAVRNTQPTLAQIYPRPGTGETLLDVSAPIYVNGKHWGAFRVGSVLAENNPFAQSVVQMSTMRILIASLLLIVGVIASAWFLGRYISAPLEKLTEKASKFAGGHFDELVDIPNRAEITTLANTFNDMTVQLRGMVGTLERRVAERTSELEGVVKLSEKHAQDLQTITEIARFISSEKDLEKLLPLITQIVSEQFKFYHVGIFLLDENKKFAVLRAANSPGGQVMLRRQHKLEVGQTGIVGNVTHTGVPRIAVDTGADAIYFNNPDLPNTRSEMALPLTIRRTIIGALDVQSVAPNAFTSSDVSILSLLADQIAIAIDNARLLEETQNALAETQAVFREYTAEAWQKKSAAVLGYHQTVTGGKAITAKTVHEIDALMNDDKNALTIPIQLHDQVIGVMNIRPSSEKRIWNVDETSVAQSVAERLGLALDNARLFEETSTRAVRERTVTDIATKIRGTNDPQKMIKTAVKELQRALNATKVEIVPQKVVPPSDK